MSTEEQSQRGGAASFLRPSAPTRLDPAADPRSPAGAAAGRAAREEKTAQRPEPTAEEKLRRWDSTAAPGVPPMPPETVAGAAPPAAATGTGADGEKGKKRPLVGDGWDKYRAARDKLPPLDLDEFLFSSGEATQTIPVSDAVTVRLRRPREMEISILRGLITRLRQPGSVVEGVAATEYPAMADLLDRHGAIILGVAGVRMRGQDAVWSPLTAGEPTPHIEAAILHRVRLVGGLNDLALHLFQREVTLFAERCREQLDAEALGNG